MMFYGEIFRAFYKEKVKYVLVGGVAANIHGSERSTVDLDILVEMSGDNLKKITKIFKRLGYSVKQPVDPIGIADEKTRRQWIDKKHMKAFNFYKEKEYKEVDIIIDSPVSFEEAAKGMRRIKVDNLVIPVISIDKLIKMKSQAGRKVDKFDIEELKRIKKIRKKL